MTDSTVPTIKDSATQAAISGKMLPWRKNPTRARGRSTRLIRSRRRLARNSR